MAEGEREIEKRSWCIKAKAFFVLGSLFFVRGVAGLHHLGKAKTLVWIPVNG